ncbi:MAG: HlyD family efflux transporter periplasmic adaptor subunit [Gammaproteobacteria bacterium]|nr:HlyD family efflux transporter periplasmic adaptor subunit [Gammaproteobacteria bacterium]
MLGSAPVNHWLSVQCRLIDATAKGVVFVGAADGSCTATAVSPADYAVSPVMTAAARGAIQHGQFLFAAGNDSEHEMLAAPLVRDGKIYGAVVFEVPRLTNEQRAPLAQMLQVGSLWLDQLELPATPKRTEQLGAVLDLVAACLTADSFAAAATTLVTELAARLGCDRVSLGVIHGRHIKLQALANNAGFSQRQQLARQLEAAMDEALEHETTVLHPPVPNTRVPIAHAELARWQQSSAICTIPLHHRQSLLGALTFERSAAQSSWDADNARLFEQIALLVGPILQLRRSEDRGLLSMIGDAAHAQWQRWFGPGHLLTKLGGGSVVLLLVLLTVISGQYQVTADALLEGRIERIVAAPQKGFLQSVSARPGDVVTQGAVLAALDDRDLKLEQLKWSAKQEQVLQEYRRALAEHDRIQIGVLNAQLAQAESQLALTEKQLGRAQLIAPFDGIVISGDFSQALGSPVERGQVLFKLAPLDDYRVILKVDETDIADVRAGQRGRLTLTAMPDEALAIVVERITPVASTDAHANYFRVEAKLDKPLNYLRPGMQGIAKIDIDSRQLISIWTRSLINWLRLKWWSWLP